MKISLTVLVCLALPMAVFADDGGKKVPVKESYETLDMKQMTLPGEPLSAKKSGITTKVGCLDAIGRTLSQGEPGFDACVMNRVPKNPGDQPTNMNIQFGQ